MISMLLFILSSGWQPDPTNGPAIYCKLNREQPYVYIAWTGTVEKMSDFWPEGTECPWGPHGWVEFMGCIDLDLPGADPYGPMPLMDLR